MNCKKFTQLIPLFIEADLAEAEMQSLTEHFAACKSCGDTVKEFQSSQSLLHTFTAPEFDEEVFKQVRRSVLNEIARPQISNLSQPFWNWKTAFAASFAIIILLSGIAINRHSSSKNYVAQVSNTGEAKANNFSSSASKNMANNSSNLNRIPKPRSGRNSIARGEASVSKRNPGKIGSLYPSPERATDTNREEIISINNDILSPLAPPLETAAIPNTENPIPEPEMLRMEIQTADPNIKIIWLMPQTPTRTNTLAETK